MIYWNSENPPLLLLLLAIVFVFVVLYLWRVFRRRYTMLKAVLLFLPRVILLLLLFFAIYDPVRVTVGEPEEPLRLVLVSDISSSMDIADGVEGSRVERAETIKKGLLEGFDNYVDVSEEYFSDMLYQERPAEGGEIRNTDLGKVLVDMCVDETVMSSEAIIMLTDGGDQVVDSAVVPGKPLYIVGVGADENMVPDASIEEIDCPEVVDLDNDIELVCELGFRNFSDKAATAELVLEESVLGQWQQLAVKPIDVSSGRSKMSFPITDNNTPGVRRFRVTLGSGVEELTLLNNSRELSIEIRDKMLSVLYYAHELGWEFRSLRKELESAANISLTALFRLMQSGASSQFIVQSQDTELTSMLSGGFPDVGDQLEKFDCIVIDSIPAESWSVSQVSAIKDYVEEGGAVIFLGGEQSFAAGGYLRNDLSQLMPFALDTTEREVFRAGEFPVSVPGGARGNSIVSGIAEKLDTVARPVIESINISGKLKTASIELLSAGYGDKTVPLVVLGRYGKGRVLTVCSNTFWKWSRAGGVLGECFGQLWRQSVLAVTDSEESGRVLSVKWSKDSYNPGEKAMAIVNISSGYMPGAVHLRETVLKNDKEFESSIKQADESGQVYNLEFMVSDTGSYYVTMDAFLAGSGSGEQLLEKYSKVIRSGNQNNEGAYPWVDHIFLNDLASRSGGAYFREHQVETLKRMLQEKAMSRAVQKESPLVAERYIFLTIFLIVITFEWYMRRKLNLI